MLIIKSLGRTESAVTITIYMSLVMAPLSLIAALFDWQWPTAEQLIWLIAIGTLGGAGQMSMAQALRTAETHVVMPVDFVKLIWVSAIAYVAFAEVPDAFTWIGGTMIFASTAFIAWREHVKRAAPKPPAEPT
jgi:drug/metabolite transporter (DMT)-like permease